MMFVRRLGCIGLLSGVACAGLVGCAEDNNKNMEKVSQEARADLKGAAPVAAPANEPPRPQPTDQKAMEKYQQEQMKRMYSSKGYPGVR